MSRLIFVTTELHPETPGGAGVLVDTLSRLLATRRPVTILLCAPSVPTVADHGGAEVVAVRIPESGFLARAETVARAVADRAEPGDRVEFQDFEGIGFLALAHRMDLGLDRTLMTVRFHGPYDLLAEAMDTPQDDWDIPAAMEREAFRMADRVIIPVEGHRETLVTRYDLEPDRIVLGPPPVDPLPRLKPRPGTRAVFAVVGRLAEVKGSQDMVDAALRLIEGGLDFEIRFVGGDGWSPTTATSMQERLVSMIPLSLRDAFVFTGAVDRTDLPELLSDVTAVVVPSRFESFCLAAHEARGVGLPVIVADLPAFRGVLDSTTGALVYDGSVAGLADAMRRFVDEPDLAADLASRSAPSVGDPTAPYNSDHEPRHPRAQAGLATAATQNLEKLWKSKQQQRPSLLREIYRRLPEPVLTLLRRAPRPIRERAKGSASWQEESTRRYRQEMERDIRARLDLVAQRISAGDFPDFDDPDVTVVIPVHDDVRFLDETLASVYEQTHDSWEIVVVDDGSTDAEAIAHLDSLQRPRLRLIRQENRGLPAARNTGMAAARGRFLVPLDSDDQLQPEFLERMIEALDPHPEAAYAHCYARLHHDVDAVWVTRPFNPYWQLIGNGVVGCVLLRREAWEQVGGYDETMTLGNEDWELWLRLMERRWGQVQVPRVLFRYRKHGISMSVRTEARFEEGRRMVRDRHPDLYDATRLARLKARWYPVVSAVTEIPDRPQPEIEVIPDFSRLGTTWGKYVVDVRGVEPFPTDLVMALAKALEDEPGAGRAVTDGLPPVVMVRRWSLHDPDGGPKGVVVVDNQAMGREVEIPAHVLRPGWSVPEHVVEPGVPVQRQPPEEAGFAPDPSRW